ncbi:MAG: SCP2 sterol-binding domain-containing protein [Myxococcales bacterium]|jgi:putative sterol carrier protein|nr:SCP2 sterol-binding domain-containing protein [Myxococcales bacterium]
MPDAKTSFTETIPKNIARDPERARSVGAVYLFRITGEGGGVWTVDLKNEPGVIEGETGEADCVIECTSETWRRMSDQPASAMQFFFQGEIQVTGNAMLAMKLQSVIA